MSLPNTSDPWVDDSCCRNGSGEPNQKELVMTTTTKPARSDALTQDLQEINAIAQRLAGDASPTLQHRTQAFSAWMFDEDPEAH